MDERPRTLLRRHGATAYNVLQNNGAAAHQVVMHVHFHIIAKFPDAGLGIGWNAGRLDEKRAHDLAQRMRAAMEKV